MEAANLPTFLKFGIAKKSDICVICAKKSWVATKLGRGPGAKLGATGPPPWA